MAVRSSCVGEGLLWRPHPELRLPYAVHCHTLQLDFFLLASFRKTADMLASGRELLTSGTGLHIHMLWRDCGFNRLTHSPLTQFPVLSQDTHSPLRIFWLLVVLSAVGVSEFQGLEWTTFLKWWTHTSVARTPEWGSPSLTLKSPGSWQSSRPPQHREVAEQTPVFSPKTWTTILFCPDSPCHPSNLGHRSYCPNL